MEIKSSSGYLYLDSWAIAMIMQLATGSFCKNFLDYQNDPKGRQYDQMFQAARSIQANIAEGSARHHTSRETEMKLLDVARGSACELANDFLFYIIDSGQAAWEKDNPYWKVVYNLKLEGRNYGTNIMHDASQYLIAQRARFKPYLEHQDKIFCANSLLVLCGRLISILEHQIGNRMEHFAKEGGFKEELTRVRLEHRNSVDANEPTQTCPKCGKPMKVRMARTGVNSGNPFWGCTGYPACKEILPYEPNKAN